MYLCECRGPCRRSFALDHQVYRYLSRMGTVVAAECAERERREPLHQHRAAGVVVVNTIRHRLADSARHRPGDSL
jgi:hypothetical protein